MDLFLTGAGDDFRNFRDKFIQHVRRDCRASGFSRREPAKLQPFIRIGCEWIASHLQKLRVDRLLTGDAVACEPSKILPDIIKYIPNDTHFLGEMIHGVGQPFDVLGTSWFRGRCSCGFRQWIERLGRQSDTICGDRQTAKRSMIHGVVRCRSWRLRAFCGRVFRPFLRPRLLLERRA